MPRRALSNPRRRPSTRGASTRPTAGRGRRTSSRRVWPKRRSRRRPRRPRRRSPRRRPSRPRRLRREPRTWVPFFRPRRSRAEYPTVAAAAEVDPSRHYSVSAHALAPLERARSRPLVGSPRTIRAAPAAAPRTRLHGLSNARSRGAALRPMIRAANVRFLRRRVVARFPQQRRLVESQVAPERSSHVAAGRLRQGRERLANARERAGRVAARPPDPHEQLHVLGRRVRRAALGVEGLLQHPVRQAQRQRRLVAARLDERERRDAT
mmetsp:Transcript_31106/g.96254  ORF Transcript_31106/g.96254 Transcript_31106/m.96254 type:complete len:266 (-) Transcript_31106:660-1457(-)